MPAPFREPVSILNTTLTPAIKLLIRIHLLEMSTVDTSRLRPQKSPSRPYTPTLTSPTPVTIHSVFDSDGRRIAEYNETNGALIREYVWNGVRGENSEL